MTTFKSKINTKIFIINGLPQSGKHTFVSKIGFHERNVTYINSNFPLVHIADNMGIDETLGLIHIQFMLKLKILWNKYNTEAYDRFISFIEEELHVRKDYKVSSVLFLEINNRKDINKTKLILSTLGVKANTILFRRDGVKYPQILSYYDLSDDYDVIVNNNKTVKDLERKALEFRRLFLNKTSKRHGTTIF